MDLFQDDMALAIPALAPLFARTIREHDCWLWDGAVSASGYAVCSVAGKVSTAARHIACAQIGAIPKGVFVSQSCGNRRCCRPAHLKLIAACDLAGLSQSAEMRRLRGLRGRRPATLRFWKFTDKRSEDECWPWRAGTDSKGYGILVVDRRKQMATHVALAIAGQPRPAPDLCALHSCDNPICVNPAHLRWGTKADNTRDMMSRGRGRNSSKEARHGSL